MRKRTRLLAAAGTAVAVTAGLGGAYGAAYGADSTSASIKAVPLYSPHVTSPALPLDAYQLTDEQVARQSNTRNLLTIACMRSFGQAFLPGYTDRTKIIAATFATYSSRRYGVTDPVAAQRYGYELPPEPSGSSDGEPTSKMPFNKRRVLFGLSATGRPSLTPGAGIAVTTAPPGTLNGKPIPVGGCLHQADQQLGLTTTAATSKATTLAATISHNDYGKTLSDARTLAANRAWSACMATYGYRYQNPQAAISTFNLNKPAQLAQIKAAVTDVTCKTEVGYVATLSAVESGYQTASIKQNAQTLTSLKTLVTRQTNAVTAAARTLGD